MLSKMLTIFTTLFVLIAKAQFAPQVGVVGSDAISAEDIRIKYWANKSEIIQGKRNISIPNSLLANAGEANFALGKADANTVSLGDSGVAILQMDGYIYNGSGVDFCIFENGFTTDIPESAFLELAFVEVSSNGIDYFRFPAQSLTDTSKQIPAYGTMDAKKIKNLAGKYIQMYGTPFDLEELKMYSNLNINKVTHIRIVDVIGSVNPKYGTYDSANRIINDPYPTDIASSGFDLDAMGILNGVQSNGIDNPKPYQSKEFFTLNNNQLRVNYSKVTAFHLFNSNGKEINSTQLQTLSKGVYLIRLDTKEYGVITEKFICF